MQINIRYILKDSEGKFNICDFDIDAIELGLDLQEYEIVARNLSTNLKDRNGKEIYEGDILKDEDSKYRKVIFADGCFLVENKNGDTNFVALNNHFEVIGSIYENPELLK